MSVRPGPESDESIERFELHCEMERETGHDFDVFSEKCRRCWMTEELWKRAGYPKCLGSLGTAIGRRLG